MSKPQKRPKQRRLLTTVLCYLFWFLIIILVFITSFRWINPPTTSAIIQENIHQSKWRSSDRIHFNWQDWHDIAKPMAVAVIASEDQRFPTHFGLDLTELSKAFQERNRRVRGASTITQQVVKNLFLWQQKSYFRKAVEAVIAIYVDFVWGKQRVLEIYLNIVQFGPNLYGVENASQTIFNKPAAKLNRFEAARLAAVLPNPNRRSAQYASEYVISRQSQIMKQMRAIGGIAILEEL